MNIVLYFDGSCEPVNPGGVATFGFALEGLGGITEGVAEVAAGGLLGQGSGMTNNLAEYAGLRAGLARLLGIAHVRGVQFGPDDTLTIKGDSKLVVEQVAGNWAANAPHLREQRDQVRAALHELGFGTVKTVWVPREQNQRADALARFAYEQHTGKPYPERQRRA